MEISLEDFRSQVVRDYRCAEAAKRVQKLAAERQLDNALICNCNLAQVVMAKYVTPSDRFVFPRRHVAFEFARANDDNFHIQSKLDELTQSSGKVETDYNHISSGDMPDDAIVVCGVDANAAVTGVVLRLCIKLL